MEFRHKVRSEEDGVRTSDMHASRKSDGGIISMKQANKGDQLPKGDHALEESVEKRPPAKRNSCQTTVTGTQGLEASLSGLARVRKAAQKDSRLRFNNLLTHVTTDLLRRAFKSLKKQAAPGVDGVTWETYNEGLEGRLEDLKDRIHSGRYRARPSERRWIPKSDGRKRPLGIAALEDKIVQQALAWIIQEVFEADFLGFSYGFRPGKSPHNALDALYVAITQRKVNWVLDADVRSFFDNIEHEWLMKFLEHRVTDPRVLRLVRKFLRAGVLEEGEWTRTVAGTPQGAVISPLLANIYLHYVLDLWVNEMRKKVRGEVYIVRYADDFVMGFQYKADAEVLLEQMKRRFARFGLELHDVKTRLIEFGRFANSNRRSRGEGKAETFDFLGFTHICGTRRKDGSFTLRRRTIAKRLRTKIKEVREVLKWNMHAPVPKQGKWIRAVVQGYFNYHAVPGNQPALQTFRTQVIRAWFSALRRRSQKGRSLTWDSMQRLIKSWLPGVRVLHPYPNQRLRVGLKAGAG